MATLQQQVQQHLDSTGISLSELARRSGISHQAIGKIRALLGEYKNGTADALRIAIKPKTLDATVEKLAAQCIDSDLTHHADWDTDLQCAKYRRVMALEKELNDEKRNFAALEQVHDHVAGNLKSCENALIEAHETITKQEQQLNDANTAYLSSKSQHERDLQRLNDANAEIKRLTALSETHSQSWKAACVQAEQLQKQLDHGQAAYSKLYNQLGATRAKYETQLEAANQKEAQLQEQLTEVYATKTRQEAQIMRLRVYVWILIAALVFVLFSGLVVWGGV